MAIVTSIAVQYLRRALAPRKITRAILMIIILALNVRALILIIRMAIVTTGKRKLLHLAHVLDLAKYLARI